MSKNILIVESDSNLTDAMRSELEHLGFAVEESSDGKASLERMRESPPDLVVMAVELPAGQNGYLLCGKMKKDSHLKQIPVVIIGPPDGFAAHSKLKTNRANDYVAKPLDMEVLVERIGKLIGFPDGAAHVNGQPAAEVAASDEGVELLSTADVQLEEEAIIHDPELDMLDAAFDITDSEEVSSHASEESGLGPPVADHQYPPPQPSPSDLQQLRNQVSGLQQALAQADRRADEAENQILTLKAELETKNAAPSRGKADKESASVREALTKKDREILQLHTEITEKEREILDLREREMQLEQQQATASDEVASRDTQLAQYSEALTDTQQRLRRTESELDELRQSSDKLEVAMQEAQQECSELKGQMEALRAELDNSRSELDERNAQVNTLQAELEAANEQLSSQAAIASELDGLREQVRQLEAANVEYEERVGKLYQRVQGDEKSRERVKKALTIALQLVEQQSQSGEGDEPATA